MTNEDIVVVLDVETTGLNPWEGSRLLEVACIVTDTNLNPLPGGEFQAVIGKRPLLVEYLKRHTVDFVIDMHTTNGLWDEVLASDSGIRAVDRLLFEHIKKFAPDPRQARILGNSIRLDLNFLEAEMSLTYGHLHYRSIDMTAVSYFADEICGLGTLASESDSNHRAMGDARASLRQAQRWAALLTEEGGN